MSFDQTEAARILDEASVVQGLSQRLDHISRGLVGRPYAEGLLGGGPEIEEELRIDLGAFDCVTLIETVIALALTHTSSAFVDTIRQIRYEDGKVDWFSRNHYMIDWARNNEQAGFVKNLTGSSVTLEKSCRLGLIAGLTAKTTTFEYFPAQTLTETFEEMETGDLLLFVSTKETLDVFHTGLIVVSNEQQRLLRHATRTAGAVIEQELEEFLSQNTMAGFIHLRPICRR